jgi:hypothetical protein
MNCCPSFVSAPGSCINLLMLALKPKNLNSITNHLSLMQSGISRFIAAVHHILTIHSCGFFDVKRYCNFAHFLHHTVKHVVKALVIQISQVGSLHA